jgi:hypothetical protein
MTETTPKDIRKARAYLHKHGISSKEVPPHLFAATAKKTGKTFSDLLKTIARLMNQGQGEGEAPIATRIAEKNS